MIRYNRERNNPHFLLLIPEPMHFDGVMTLYISCWFKTYTTCYGNINLRLNFAIKNWWSEPQSAPALAFADNIIGASPSLASKNIIWFQYWPSGDVWVQSSPGLLERGVCFDQHVLLTKLLGFAVFILYSKTKLACYSGYLLTSWFCIPIHYDEKDTPFWCSF